MPRFVDVERLQTVHHYAEAFPSKTGTRRVTVGYVYKLIRDGKLPVEVIDGMQFVVLPESPSPAPDGAGR